MSNVYLIHFDKPFGHAQHYAGYSKDDVLRRFEEHRTGRGARLCAKAVQAGIQLQLARVWANVERKFELKIKGRGLRSICPLCVGFEAAFKERK